MRENLKHSMAANAEKTFQHVRMQEIQQQGGPCALEHSVCCHGACDIDIEVLRAAVNFTQWP